MKRIAKNEIFKSLSGFLKSRGIELTDGSYAKGVQQSCTLLTNAINLGQESIEKAKVEVDKTCGHLRQVIHEKTAPRTQESPATPKSAARPGPAKTRQPAPKATGSTAGKSKSRPKR